MHPLAFYLLLLPMSAQADVYKCVDKAGKVTYTNSACAKAGLKEAKLIPPPPPPAIDARPKAAPTIKPASVKTAALPQQTKQASAVQVMKATSAQDGCGKLNADMGRILDQMDAARTQGATARQQSEWNNQLDRLQAEKSRLGCF